MFRLRVSWLRVSWLRVSWLAVCWLGVFSLCCTPSGFASTFGYSVNINFGAEQQPIRDFAGIFRDRVWNNFDEPLQDQPMRVLTDVFGDNGRASGVLQWNSPGIGIADRVKRARADDARMMRGFLDSPSMIVLDNLDQVVPDQQGPVSYTLILYTFGGQEGAEGQYKVNGRVQNRVDSSEFVGDFKSGINGNMLIFENLLDPQLVIETDGFAPINAMSLIYCRPGDFNGDGILDVTDLDELSDAVKEGSGEFTYDVNFDLVIDFDDVLSWIKCSKGTSVGDVNLDGVFDSTDLIELFQQGVYNTGDSAKWTSGDWNGDWKFDSSDLLFAFQEGGYESGGALATSDSHVEQVLSSSALPVPEPATAWSLAIALLGLSGASRRWQRNTLERKDV